MSKQCKGITATGKQCGRKIIDNNSDYCWQHKKNTNNIVSISVNSSNPNVIITTTTATTTATTIATEIATITNNSNVNISNNNTNINVNTNTNTNINSNSNIDDAMALIPKTYEEMEEASKVKNKSEHLLAILKEMPHTINNLSNGMDEVYLKCVKEKNRLRIIIVSPGYIQYAHVSFPSNMRVENAYYAVPAHTITFRGFYVCSCAVRDKHLIRIATRDEVKEQWDNYNKKLVEGGTDAKILKIFEDTETEECAVCMCESKDTVFDPCGHFYCCHSCAKQLKLCPICRIPIVSLVNRKDVKL